MATNGGEMRRQSMTRYDCQKIKLKNTSYNTFVLSPVRLYFTVFDYFCQPFHFFYCPFCGAKMDEEADDE